jgi:predicted SAM-dependent methyltransferase
VQGVELNGDVARFASEKYGLDIAIGTLEEARLPDNAFDAVTMWDVLEHVYDPATTLAEIHRILKPDGVLVIRVPNLDAWDARLFRTRWAGYDAPRHLFIFRPKTLSALLEQQGFDVAAHSTAISSYMVFALDVRNWASSRRVSPKAMRRLNTLLYHPLTRLATAPFFYVFNFGLRGPVLVTTARNRKQA